MPNTYKNKVVVDGATLIDLTADTVTAADVAQGKTFHLPSGAPATGTATGGGSVYQDADGYLVLDDEGGGSSVTVEALSVTANGTYTAPTGKAYSPVTVSVPQPSGSTNITENGTYDVTDYAQAVVNVSGGGGDTWSWMGKNPTKLGSWYEKKSFSELGIGSWTWSTSAYTVRASTNLSPSYEVNFSDSAIVVTYEVRITYDYGDWTPVSAFKEVVYTGTTHSDPKWAMNTLGRFSVAPASSTGAYVSAGYYYNASGEEKYAGDSTYGVYHTAYSPTFLVVSNPVFSITARTPAITIRGNNTYFSSAAFSNLDLDNSVYEMTVEMWKVDAATNTRGWPYSKAYEMIAST